MTHAANLQDDGFQIYDLSVAQSILATIGEAAFSQGAAGKRCLLDLPEIREISLEICNTLIGAGLISANAVAIQAIAFDKTSAANWKVTWHQDVMFPFARPVTSDGFTLACKKAGVDYARPPQEILEDLLAVRLHIDDCDDSNGPLRVAPGSHLHGVFKSKEIHGRVAQHGQMTCVATKGEALLMKPLLLHASSPAQQVRRRRVLHLVYHSGRSTPEPWHRAVS
ncbi:phytanoyl-CoA dioxygenase family protein [Cerasicoccus frondis]|uniref:phytanoyl-CoA dioxygenase family protein n=1 Tax=Cerasicoccus frondis TaxID=490090 RepID=UPI002852A79C|nr:phytanoyl-CoA dioxygenase family protein [Cerasicoccus frondis]